MVAALRLRAALLARFRLYEDWRRILRHAWSVRFILFAGLCEGVSSALGFFTDVADAALRGQLSVLAFACTVLAVVARLFQQTNLGDSE